MCYADTETENAEGETSGHYSSWRGIAVLGSVKRASASALLGAGIEIAEWRVGGQREREREMMTLTREGEFGVSGSRTL